jgi:hypothetical protein
MYCGDAEAVIPLATQLAIFHCGRVRRIVKWDDGAVDARPPSGREFLRAARAARVDGGNAASFLTSF